MKNRAALPLLGALPVAAALAVFWPALRFGFVNFDDPAVLLRNPFLRSAWTWRELWTSAQATTYAPLCWLALSGLVGLFGFRPGVFHAACLAAHAANVLLVFLIARELFAGKRRDAAAALAAGLFALHPVQAEMVGEAACIAESPACGLALAAVLAHLRGRPRWALALTAASVLWHWQGLVVAVVVVAVDGLLRRRRVWKDKIPFFAIGAAAVAVQVWIKHRSGGYSSFAARPGAAALGALHAVDSWLWPGRRLPVYTYSGDGSPMGWAPWESVVFFLALSALFVVLRRRVPALLTAWICALAAVAPPLLLTGPMPTWGHDHYFYLTGVPLCLLAGAAILKTSSRAAIALFLAVLAACAFRASYTLAAWSDPEILWRRAFSVEPGSPMFAYRLGEAILIDGGRAEEAIAYFRIQRRADPGETGRVLGHAYDRRAGELLRAGRRREAAAALEEALRWDPGRPELLANLAAVRNGILKTR